MLPLLSQAIVSPRSTSNNRPQQSSPRSTLPYLALHGLPSPRPLPKLHMKPQLDPDFVPMTKGRKGPKSDRFVVNMDDCHTPELVVQGFTTMLADIRASFARIDATTAIFRAEMDEANDVVQYICDVREAANNQFDDLATSSAVTIQRVHRGNTGRRQCLRKRQASAAIQVQRIFRGRLARRAYVTKKLHSTVANTVLGLRAMHNLHQDDKLLQLDDAQTGDRAATLLRMLKASITIQSRWRVAYNKVRGNVSDIQTVQARAGRLNRLLVRVAWQVATTIGILRYWRKATALNLLSKPAALLRQQLHRRRSSIEIAANAMIAARLRFAAIAEAAPRHAEQHAEHVIENVSFFAQPPKAWYTRHAGSDSVVKSTTSSHSTASLPPPPPPPSFASPKAHSKTNVVLLGNNKARSSSLPLTNTQRDTSRFGIVPNVVATTTEVTRAYQAVHSSVAPRPGHVKVSPTKVSNVKLSPDSMRQRQATYDAKRKANDSRAGATKDITAAMGKAAYQEAGMRRTMDRQRQLKVKVEQRKHRRVRHRFISAKHKQTTSLVKLNLARAQGMATTSTANHENPSKPLDATPSCHLESSTGRRIVADAINSAMQNVLACLR
ncbi:hypothetical protein, variant 1 [Aphanomyces astaci]|uniref:Uncharacterized protein n=1 Tax=Aphanomyces astaci TaxID=112090 RepID=W4FW21_APHAT|nr:hypothetical protein, variant 1 [Aphanomyces astaci]ETV71014.1 hypothetical protein, variant 1 [Aphanomyces astaci]|eukprot:XP_009839679.1 hypothetical protein, variant 1 [Aphanomyces astaci]